MNDFFLLPLVFVLSFLGTWLVIHLSKGRHWLDIPNDRSSHTAPTPTAGGVAFVVIFLVASLISFSDVDPGFNYLAVLFLSFCIAVMGLVDDVFQLGIAPRIISQFIGVVAVLAIFGIPVIPVFSFNLDLGWPGYILLSLAFLWFINLFNFMDGIDGIAASETLFICLAFLLLTFPDYNVTSITGVTTMLLFLAAAVSGFLLLNFSPARIFMGDTGSYFLAFILGVAALASSAQGITNIWVWCILAGAFIIDATYTLFSRMGKRETWYYAHRTHAYQLLSRHLQSHGKVVLLLSSVNCCWLLPLAWLAHTQPQWGLVMTIVAWLPLLLLVRKISTAIKFNDELE
jgi:Fuc2NAc and GlcNAc transferase